MTVTTTKVASVEELQQAVADDRAGDIVVAGTRSKVASVSYMPTWDRHPDYTVLPIGDALRRHQAPASVLRASYRRTTSVVGRIPHRLTPVPAHLG